MTMSAIGSRNSGERVKLQVDGEIARCVVEEIEELQLGVLQGGVWHVVNERNIQLLGGRGASSTAPAAGSIPSPARWYSATLNNQRHVTPPPTTTLA
jgi:hypothetical protein